MWIKDNHFGAIYNINISKVTLIQEVPSFLQPLLPDFPLQGSLSLVSLKLLSATEANTHHTQLAPGEGTSGKF